MDHDHGVRQAATDERPDHLPDAPRVLVGEVILPRVERPCEGVPLPLGHVVGDAHHAASRLSSYWNGSGLRLSIVAAVSAMWSTSSVLGSISRTVAACQSRSMAALRHRPQLKATS